MKPEAIDQVACFALVLNIIIKLVHNAAIATQAVHFSSGTGAINSA